MSFGGDRRKPITVTRIRTQVKVAITQSPNNETIAAPMASTYKGVCSQPCDEYTQWINSNKLH